MSTLKLQILLGAVDKLTAPLKAVTGQSRITAKDLADTKAKVRDLEKQSGQIDGYRTLGRQIGATRAQLTQAQHDAQQMAQAFAKVEQPTKAMTRAMDEAKQKVRDLSQQERAMVARYGRMKLAMGEAGINTKQLGEHQRRLKTDLASANTQLDQQRTKLGQLADQQKRLNQVKASYRQTQELRGQIAGHGATALATGAAMGLTTLKPVIEFARAETSVVDLKVSMMGKGGQVRQEFQAISDLATKLGNKLPGTTADFQNMMSTLIQQGMSAKSILGGLGEATAYLGVQLKMPFDQAALFAAKLQDATGTAEQDMMGLMDTIQRSFYLGVDSGNMLGAFTKLTPAMGILRKSGLEAAKVLAPLVIMADQAGMAGESSGNAYRKVFQMSMNTGKIAKATKGTGLKLNFTDGKGEFAGMENMFAQLAKLKGLNTERRLQVLKGIYGDDAETLQVLELIINKGMDGYRATQKKMADQAALQERVNAQLGTLGSLWDAATGTFTNAMVNFGEAIAPEIKAITEWIAELSERLGDWAKKNPELSNTLMKVGGILSAVTIAFGGLSLAVAAVLGPMAIMKLTFGIIGIKGTFLGKVITMLLGPLKWLTASIFRLGVAMMTTPLGWIIGLLAALAYAVYYVYKNWDELGPKFKAVWETCKAATMEFWDYISTLPTKALEMGKALISSLVDGISAKWESLKAKIKGITDLLPDWWNGGSEVKASVEHASTAPAVQAGKEGGFAGFYDKGGLIPAGKWGIAGEHGPEVVKGPASIISRRHTAAMASAAMLASMPLAAMQPHQDATRTIRERVVPAELRQPADTARTIREQVMPAELRQPADTVRTIREQVMPAELRQPADTARTIREQVVPAELRQPADTVRTIREQVMPAELRQPADTARTIREQVMPAELRQPADTVRTIREQVMPAELRQPADTVRTIREQVVPAELRQPADTVRTIREQVMPAVLRQPADTVRTIREQVMPAVLRQPADATRTIREQVTPAELRQPADTVRTIREQVMPAELRQPADTALTIREQVVPAVLRQPSDAIRSSPRIIDTPKLAPARGGGSTQIHAPISIVQQPGQSSIDVAQEVRRELDRRERQASALTRASLRDNS